MLRMLEVRSHSVFFFFKFQGFYSLNHTIGQIFLPDFVPEAHGRLDCTVYGLKNSILAESSTYFYVRKGFPAEIKN
jgi:hypothetical protein